MHFISIQYFSELHSVMKGFKENLSYLNFENNDHEIRIFLQKTQYLPKYDQFSLKILYKHLFLDFEIKNICYIELGHQEIFLFCKKLKI